MPGLTARVDNLEQAVVGISNKIDKLVDRLGQQQRPQYGLIISLCTFVFMLLAAAGGSLILPLKSDISHEHEARLEMDTKLQAEIKGAVDSMEARASSSDATLRAKQDMNMARLDRLERLHDEQTAEDEQELRQRRMRESGFGRKQ